MPAADQPGNPGASVLQVIPSLAIAHGGPSRALVLIEKALRAQGIRVQTATTDDDGEGGRNGVSDSAVRHEQGGERRYFRKTLNPYKVSLPFARWIFANVRQFQIVHIHALFSFTSTVAALAARAAGVPYVVRPLGTLANYGMSQRRPWLKSLSLQWLERGIVRSAAAVHFTSEVEQREAESLGLEFRGVVIPLAVEPGEDGQPAIPDLLARFPQLRGKRCVLFLSRLDPKKNIEGLLDAIALCTGVCPDVLWVIAGSGAADYTASLLKRAAALGVSERVLWAGHLQGRLKAAAFALAELFVLPSYSENFGIAAAEALQAGLPVVLGEGVALSTEVEAAGAGKSVDPSPASVAAAMLAYLQDPAARAVAGGKARQLAEQQFSLETMGARLASLYQAVLNSPDRKWQGQVDNA